MNATLKAAAPMRGQRKRWILLSLFALTLGGCGGEEPPTAVPVPGRLTLELSSPNSNDGGMLVTVTGPGMGDVQVASSAYGVYHRLASSNELRLAVIGRLANGPIVTIGVADVGKAGSYQATITEVANTSDVIAASLTGYSMKIVRSDGGAP